MRLVPAQNSDDISKKFQNYFEGIAPKSVKVKVKPHHGGEPVVVSTESPGYKAASMAMTETFGKKPLPTRGGGSIPIVALFKKELGLDSILFGFGLDSDALHSPNEHYGLFNYYKGIETIPLFYKFFSQLKEKSEAL
jgi:acetylornithine deacetylase/succinyl-diaminopimelate desuccinylase-like protein